MLPIYNVQEILSNEYTDAELLYMNKMLAAMIISNEGALKKLMFAIANAKGDERLVSNQIANIRKFFGAHLKNLSKSIVAGYDAKIAQDSSLTTELTQAKQKALDNIEQYKRSLLEDYAGQPSFTFRSLSAFLSREFNINIDISNYQADGIVEDDSTGVEAISETSKNDWEDRKTMSIDKSTSMAKEVRMLIATTIFKDTSNVNVSDISNEPFGIREPLSVREVWNSFTALMASTQGTRMSVIKAMRVLDKISYDNRLSKLIDALEKNDAVWNSFNSTVNLDAGPITTQRMSVANNITTIRDRVLNFRAISSNVAMDNIKANIHLKFENAVDYLSQITDKPGFFDTSLTVAQNIQAMTARSSSPESMSKIKNIVDDMLLNFGINGEITWNDIVNTAQIELAPELEIIDNPFTVNIITNKTEIRMLIEALDEALKSNQNPIDRAVLESRRNGAINLELKFIGHVNQVITDLLYIQDAVIKAKKKQKSLKGAAKNRFRINRELKIDGAVRSLSRNSLIRNHSNTVQSYFNENGDMEQTPQYPSFLTDLRKAIQPIGGKIDFNAAKDFFDNHGYLTDPTLQNNPFIWNDKSTTSNESLGMGLFDYTLIDGRKVATGINPDFARTFNLSQFSGLKNADNGVGMKYESILGDSWLFHEITNSLRGVHVIHSADSGRSFQVQMRKFGMAGFMFNNSGRVQQFRGLLVKNNIIDDLGNFTPRSLENMSDEDIYFLFKPSTNINIKDGDLITSNGFFTPYTIGRIKELASKEGMAQSYKDIIKSYYNFVRWFLISANDPSISKYVDATYNSAFEEELLKGTGKKPSGNTLKNMAAEFAQAEENGDVEAKTAIMGKLLGIDDFSDISKNAIMGIGNVSFERLEAATNAILDTMLSKTDGKVDPRSPNLMNKFAADVDTLLYHTHSVNNAVSENYESFLETAKNVVDNRTLQSQASSLLNDEMLIENDRKLKAAYETYRNSKTYRAIKRAVETEMSAMRLAANKAFSFEYSLDGNGRQYISKTNINPNIAEDAQAGLLSNIVDYMGTVNGSPKLLETVTHKGFTYQRPTGQVFDLHRLSFTRDGKKITLNEFAKQQSNLVTPLFHIILSANKDSHPKRNNVVSQEVYDAMTPEDKANNTTEQLLIDDVVLNRRYLDNLFDSFMDEYLSARQQEYIDATVNIADDIKITLVDSNIEYIPGTSESKRGTGERGRSWIISTDKTIAETSEDDINNSDEATVGNTISKLRKQSEAGMNRDYAKAMLEASLNDFIMQTHFDEDVLVGKPYEYKGILDVNKRASQTFKNGKSNNSRKTFTSMTISDVEVVSNMTEILRNTLGDEFVQANYGNTMEVGNGLSMISVDQYIERLKAVNMYDGKLKQYIDDLSNPQLSFDQSKYDYIAEQCKYFLYTRRTASNGLTAGTVRGYQEKNSTIVLFPNMFRGTEYANLSRWMKSKGIDEFNFLSGSKVGGQPIFKLHDTFDATAANVNDALLVDAPFIYALRYKTDDNGNIINDAQGNPIFDDGDVDVSRYLVTYELRDLRTQQDIVGHTFNKTGNNPTQMLKKSDVGIEDNQDYIVNGKPYKGRTRNKMNPGLFEYRQYAMSYNVKQDLHRLLQTWGAIDDNGNIKIDMHGNYDIDVNKVKNTIIEYHIASNDMASMRALMDSSPANAKAGSQGQAALSLAHPTMISAIEALLQAKISKNVKQTLLQVHGTIMPDVFMTPEGFRPGKIHDKENIIRAQNFNNVTGLSLTKEMREQIERDGNFDLKSSGFVDGKYQRAQIVLNMWDPQFKQYMKTRTRTNADGTTFQEQYIDIDQIPPEARTVVCTRIPHEGMQSSFTAEVVGFMNSASSQIIVPKHLSLQTGWNYEIDSLYIYPRSLYERNGSLHPISIEHDMAENFDGTAYNTRARMLESFIADYMPNRLNAIKDVRRSAKTEARIKRDKVLGLNNKVLKQYREGSIKLSPEAAIQLQERSDVAKSLYDATIEEIDLNYSESLATLLNDPIINEKFDQQDDYYKVTRETRDNMIIDAYIARIESPYSIRLANKPNEYTHSKAVANGINEALGISNSTSNFTNQLDRINMSIMNREVSILKGLSVGNDNTVAIDGIINASINQTAAVPMVMTAEELLPKNASEAAITKALNTAIGYGNWKKLPDGNYFVLAGHIGNNAEGTWTNQAGINISEQASEITSHILDAVKDNMGKKVGMQTLNLLTLFANIPIIHNTELYSKKGTEPNAFAYSNLLIHQAFMSHMKTIMEKSQRETGKADRNRALAQTKNDIANNIITLLQSTDLATMSSTADVIDSTTVLDVIIDTLNNEYTINAKDSAEANKYGAMAKKLRNWKESVIKGDKISMIDDGVSATETFNVVTTILNETTEDGIQYFDTRVNDTLNKRSKDTTAYNSRGRGKLSNLISSLRSSKLFTIENDNIEFDSKSVKTLKQLHDLFMESVPKNKNYYDMDAATKRTRTTGFTAGLDLIRFMSDQLDVIRYYEHVSKSADLISAQGNVLCTDKKGTSPSSAISNKLFNDMSNLYIDLDTFTQDMRASGVNNADINTFKNKFLAKDTLKARIQFMEDTIAEIQSTVKDGEVTVLAKNGDVQTRKSKINEKYTAPLVPLNVHGVPLVKSVFPSVMKYDPIENPNALTTEYDFSESSYPYMEAQYVYTNHASTKMFSKVLITESPTMKAIISGVTANLYPDARIGTKQATTVARDVANIVTMERMMGHCNFFNGGSSDPAMIASLIRKTLGSVNDAGKTFDTNTGIVIADNDSKNKNLHGNVITRLGDLGSNPEKAFAELSTANQIYLLKNQSFAFGISGSELSKDIQSLLATLEPQLTIEKMSNSGYGEIYFQENGDNRKHKQTFRKMYYSNNAYLRSVTRSIVRYSFYTKGLAFGMNPSRIIDDSLYYERPNSREAKFAALSDPAGFELYNYNQQLYQLENDMQADPKDDLDNLNALVQRYSQAIRTLKYDDGRINPAITRIAKQGEASFRNTISMADNN